MKVFKLFLLSIAVAFGAFMIVYGEKDDSPGAQFLGLVLIGVGIVSAIRGVGKTPPIY